jgi:hypothetical protein
MKTNLKIIVLSLVLGLAAPIQVSNSQVSGEVHIRIAPPAPVHETRGARPDAGAVWIGGYHEYDPASSSYHWHQGTWDHAPRAGAKWVAPKYKRSHGEYKYTEGRWK